MVSEGTKSKYSWGGTGESDFVFRKLHYRHLDFFFSSLDHYFKGQEQPLYSVTVLHSHKWQVFYIQLW